MALTSNNINLTFGKIDKRRSLQNKRARILYKHIVEELLSSFPFYNLYISMHRIGSCIEG